MCTHSGQCLEALRKDRERPMYQKTLERNVSKTTLSFPISSPIHVVFIKIIKRRHRAQYERQTSVRMESKVLSRVREDHGQRSVWRRFLVARVTIVSPYVIR